MYLAEIESVFSVLILQILFFSICCVKFFLGDDRMMLSAPVNVSNSSTDGPHREIANCPNNQFYLPVSCIQFVMFFAMKPLKVSFLENIHKALNGLQEVLVGFKSSTKLNFIMNDCFPKGFHCSTPNLCRTDAVFGWQMTETKIINPQYKWPILCILSELLFTTQQQCCESNVSLIYALCRKQDRGEKQH